jgi:hypothetical protein
MLIINLHMDIANSDIWIRLFNRNYQSERTVDMFLVGQFAKTRTLYLYSKNSYLLFDHLCILSIIFCFSYSGENHSEADQDNINVQEPIPYKNFI